MNSVTELTCDYGLARTHDGCVRTFSSYTSVAYTRVQCINIVAGILALGVAVYKYVRSVQNDGARLQRQAFVAAIYCSMTFLVRGVDPMSFGHYIPRPLSHFLVDSCTAAIYTVFILTLAFWVSMIRQGAPSPRLRVMKYAAIAFVWAFKISVNVSLIFTKGFDILIGSCELFSTAGVLFLISSLFCFYGFRVIRRLEDIDKMETRLHSQFETLHTSRIDKLMESHATVSSDMDSQQSIDIRNMPPPPKSFAVPQPPKAKKTKKKPARKIKEMLIITEIVSLTCIAAQIYTGVTRLDGTVELRCANGVDCDKLQATWPLMHIYQYIGTWCIMFCFRKTERKQPRTALASARPLHAV